MGRQSPHWPTPQVYVLKRPHVDEFLQRMGELFECVLFTASLAKVSPPPSTGLPGHLCFLSASDTRPLGRSLWVPLGALPAHDDPPPTPQYADPVADLLDKWGAFRARLFRESCVFHRGNYVKDLSRLGRDLRRVLILDNSPASYVFHPDNAVSARQDGGWGPAGVWSLPFLPLFSPRWPLPAARSPCPSTAAPSLLLVSQPILPAWTRGLLWIWVPCWALEQFPLHPNSCELLVDPRINFKKMNQNCPTA